MLIENETSCLNVYHLEIAIFGCDISLRNIMLEKFFEESLKILYLI